MLLRKQQGKCRWCELLFQDTDVIEIDHITPKSEGGGEELSNRCLLHRHCHDVRHAKRVNGISDKDPIIEEPDAGKLACPVCAVRRVVVFLLQAGGTEEKFLGYWHIWRRKLKETKHAREAMHARKRWRAGHSYDPLPMSKAELPELEC